MAKRYRRKRRSNPSALRGYSTDVFSIAKKAAPGAASFLATTAVTGRVESLVSGQGFLGIPPAQKSTKQLIASIAVPSAFLIGAWALTSRYFTSHRASILAGVGAATAYKVAVSLLSVKQKSGFGLNGQAQRKVSSDTNSPEASSEYSDPAEYDMDPFDGLSLDGINDPDYGDLYEGMFE